LVAYPVPYGARLARRVCLHVFFRSCFRDCIGFILRGVVMPVPIVRVQDVHKYFRRGSEQIEVLKGLSLTVPEGEFLALMGPSGSGKTTLLNLIAGLDHPSDGDIYVRDELMSDLSQSQLAKWRT